MSYASFAVTYSPTLVCRSFAIGGRSCVMVIAVSSDR
jgi:hypothetical protein